MAIKVTNVSYAYEDTQALKKISFHINKKDFVALIGPNGSGKTTIVKLLLKQLTQDEGNIELFGASIDKFEHWDWVGYVPQQFTIDKNFPATVGEILSLKRGKRKDILKLLEIEHLTKRQFIRLSGGQQQRVLIALSLLSRPKLLILDEPTVGVDVQTQQEFYALLKKLNHENGVTIILVTHDVGLIPMYAKRVVCINQTVCCQGPAKHTDKFLKEVYGDDFHVHHHH